MAKTDGNERNCHRCERESVRSTFQRDTTNTEHPMPKFIGALFDSSTIGALSCGKFKFSMVKRIFRDKSLCKRVENVENYII